MRYQLLVNAFTVLNETHIHVTLEQRNEDHNEASEDVVRRWIACPELTGEVPREWAKDVLVSLYESL